MSRDLDVVALTGAEYDALTQRADDWYALYAMAAKDRAAALEDVERWKRDAIPEGFVLVPKEPTNEMQEAFYVEIEKGEWAINTWEAMIAAAQKGESCNTPSPT